MIWLLSGICCILAVEILLRSSLFAGLNSMNLACRKAVFIITSRKTSDHWKQKALAAYSGRIMTASLRLMMALVLVFSPFIAAVYLTSTLDIKLYDFLASPQGLAGTAMFAALYGFARSKRGRA